MRIEDYALIGNSLSAALVGRNGSIDWLCLPRFDSPSCFTALLGNPEHGRWKIAPSESSGQRFTTTRRYRHRTLILETEFEAPDGSRARIVDLMVPGTNQPMLIRSVEGLRGEIQFDFELVLRFDYGSLVPWVRKTTEAGTPTGIVAIAGPETVRIHTRVPLQGHNFRTVARFGVRRGARIPFVLSWHPSHLGLSREIEETARDPDKAIRQATRWWTDWSGRCAHQSPWAEDVERSLITLKALTHAQTSGIVAAPTTSLPEFLGGVRNWDYRQCWLRDASFTLWAFTDAGYYDEARAWRDWLLRAVAGKPSDLRIMYGPAGERRLTELELPWLPGYESSSPVRIGNAAFEQLQLDVFGEVINAFYYAHADPELRSGTISGTRVSAENDRHDWRVHRQLVEYLEGVWREPDNGIWEIRGPRRQFTHSKVMAWVAFDRALRASERVRLDAPTERWRKQREAIRAQIEREGFSREKNAFVQFYGSQELDASLLLMPLVGFLPANDPRMRSTTEAIRRELSVDGFIYRYRTLARMDASVDGLPPGEGAFLPCTFWLANNLTLQGRLQEARAIFERLLSIRNDVGLLAEEYDPRSRRFLGNFPQAFSHVALINTAIQLGAAGAEARACASAGNAPNVRIG